MCLDGNRTSFLALSGRNNFCFFDPSQFHNANSDFLHFKTQIQKRLCQVLQSFFFSFDVHQCVFYDIQRISAVSAELYDTKGNHVEASRLN